MAEIDLQLVTLGLAIVVLLLTVVVLLLLGRVNRLARMTAGRGAEGITPSGHDAGRLQSQVDRLGGEVARLRVDAESAFRRVGVVRYDAFRDIGGHMSVSIALLNDRRDGIVISILNGREGSRGYAKTVRAGASASPLSEEEQEALAQALDLAPAP